MEFQSQAESKKIVIRPDITKMVKTKSGSYHKDDFIGNELTGLSLDQVKEIASAISVDTNKWSHLNNGQQRMTIGGVLRKLTTGETQEVEDARETVADMAATFRAENEENAVAIAAEKAAAKAEKAAAAGDKPKRSRKKKAVEAESAE